MKQEEANRLIKGAFGSSYDEGRLNQLIKNLISDEKPLNERSFSGQYIKDSFKGHINSYKRLMKFEDSDRRTIDVLAVEVATPHALENARTMQRNFIATYLNGSRGGKLKDAALVAFYCKDSPDWRFSLVKMDYVLDKEQNKVRKELTPARRYSFLVGKNEGTHTACKQLAAILTGKEDTTLDMLEQAFSIETVTKEFFNEYKGLYEKLKAEIEQHIKKDKITNAEFEKKGVVLADFAKRLLGQLVFLYFLQKKGWLGVEKGKAWGTGSKAFLRELYENKGDKNFFNDKLEPLFYEALATERTDNFYDQFKCRIPFLNGGLFEPISNYDWVNTDILLDDNIFGNIFSVFDQYNFTVREDEPLDKEVAVDPEMLGRVFENLIPENERKGSGTYYTPREIVHYMCQESLINYLDSKLELHREDIEVFIHGGDIAKENDATALEKQQKENYSGDYKLKLPASIHANAQAIDKALADVKICDPAIGSGAFPVGLMTEIVRARGLLNVKLGKDRRDYDFKRHAIQESIYGVDIEASAVDIAKLRLWLSLVVDEEDFKNIQPLPNLDYKIVRGNSLLGVKKDLLNNPQLVELARLEDLLFDETSKSKKEKYKKEIDEIIFSLCGSKDIFDFEIYFNKVFRENKGFDIVIANPPYVSLEKFAGQSQQKHWKKTYKTYSGRGDIYYLFYEKSNDMLKDKGALCFITSNKFMRTNSGENLRELLTSSLKPVTILDFGRDSDFEAVVDTLTYLGEKNGEALKCCVATTKNKEDARKPRQFMERESVDLPIASLSKEGWALLPLNLIQLGEKIKTTGKPLQLYLKDTERTKIYWGIKTGLDEVFCIDETTKERLIKEDPKSAELIRPLLRGRDLKKWSADWEKLYIIVVSYGFHKELEKYPAILSHLKKYEKQLRARGQVRNGQHHWLELDNNMSKNRLAEFDKPKIIYPIIAKRMRAFIDTGKYLANTKCFMIPIMDKYLVAVFNSQMMDFYYRLFFPSLADPFNEGSLEFRGVFMNKLPIAEPDEPTRRKIETLVDKIHAAKKSNPSADVSALETQIDTLIYQLYNLTSEEVDLIKNSTSK